MLHTKFGNTKINDRGYYVITTRKEGNPGKLLHRLVFEDYHNCKLDENDVIHHIDGDKTNNHPANLICMSQKAHGLLHNKDRKFSEESKKKMSEAHKGKTISEKTKKKISESHKGENHWNYGKHHSEKTKKKISEAQNTTGYLHVSKMICKKCKQGFTYFYRYSENGKEKRISSVSLEKLEQKVKSKGLEWRQL